ncbi:MAG: hypothetical protein V1792_25905, partial [Pseudomonadota bacterium]
MTVHYAKYLAVLLLTVLAFSLVKADGEGTDVAPLQPASQETGVSLALDQTRTGNPALITLAGKESPQPAEAELHEDGSVEKKEGEAGKDEVLDLKKKILELQNKQKLRFGRVALCSKVEGYGVYSPLPAGKLLPQMILYLEPANVSTLITDGRYVIDCTVDIGILDSAGNPAKGSLKSLKFHRTARSPILDLYFRLPINFTKPPPNAFSISITLHDNIKNQRTGINVRIDPKKKSQDPV